MSRLRIPAIILLLPADFTPQALSPRTWAPGHLFVTVAVYGLTEVGGQVARCDPSMSRARPLLVGGDRTG